MTPTWKSFLSRLFAPGAGRGSRPKDRARVRALRIEQLEDRVVPAFMLRYSNDGGATFSTPIADNGPGDLDAGADSIIVDVGPFSLKAVTSDFISPAGTLLALGLDGQAAPGPQDLVVQASIDGINTAPPDQTLEYDFSGTILPGGGSVTMQTWVDNSNTLFKTTGVSVVGNTGSQTAPPNGTSNTGAIGFTGQVPYAATTQIHAIFTGSQSVSLNNSNTITPGEGGASPPPGSISGVKYTDITGNGITGDDTGLGGVTINLYAADGTTLLTSTTTAPNGSYSFPNLDPGNYVVQETVPGGYVQTAGVTPYHVTVVSGQDSGGNNFANFKQITITGTKFQDITGNSFSNDDTPLAGVTIDLYQVGAGGSKTLVGTKTTGADGSYSFPNLGPGTYFVQEEVPAGSTQTGGNAGYTITATSGQNSTGNNFDNFKQITITGKKLTDITGNGITGDDTPLAGITINLFLNGGANPVATTTTGADGSYSFPNLGPGTYTVQEVLPPGYVQTAGNAGYTITATSGTDSTGNNFANFKQITISGTKYTDITGNSFSGDDTPLAGITVNLYKNGNLTTPVATTTTAADGSYSFPNLGPGTYSVQEVVPAGYTQTGGNAGYTINATSGSNSAGNNFDNFKKGSISGVKYTDITGNGITGDDTGLGGVTINLYAADGTTLLTSTTTAPNGSYSFPNLAAGKYVVKEAVPAGYTQTAGAAGYPVTINSGTDSTGNSFANFKQITISGTKFKDLTGNSFSGDDTPLAGITINLFASGDLVHPLASTVTDASGSYSFPNLGPGTYFVQEVVPAGYTQTGGNAGYTVVANSGTDASGKNFDNFKPSPGIDVEKTTNGPTNSNPTAPDYDNEDSASGPGVPVLTPGSAVTWTYKVTNTGNVPYTKAQIALVDDSGTPSNAADDLSIANGKITFLSEQTGNGDAVLDPGEVWLYKASGTVQTLTTAVPGAVSFDFTGNTALTGTAGNIRPFTSTTGGVSVKASGWSRDSSGNWAAGYLGSYGGGLGVTDTSEDGTNNTHTVDNGGRNNYVLLEFDQTVILDTATLGYVVGDSDMSIWIGTRTDPFNNHLALSDALLSSLGYTEVNNGAGSTRTADVNGTGVAGNVIVIAAKIGDADDMFKLQALNVQKVQPGVYENKAVVTVPGASDSDLSHYKNNTPRPGIDVEKTTNGPTNSNPTAPDYDNEDSASGPGVPVLTPGSAVTWTYKVTNTGNTSINSSDISLVDDAGTPSNAADDLSIANGKITFLSVQTGNGDNVLDPGEVWLYKASGTVQTLAAPSGSSVTFTMTGNTALTGAAGNFRQFTAGSVTVKATASSRDKSTGGWAAAYLGSYGGGLGVTDTSEDGTNDTHTVDNIGRDNYVLFAFDQTVVVDAATLGYVVGDSDMKIWIGTISGAFTNLPVLSDAVLASLGFSEVNLGSDGSLRTADLNNGNVAGNVLVIAADPGDTTPDDRFKIQNLTVAPVVAGVYENRAVVTVPGATDSDLSHYKNPAPPPPPPGGSISGHKYKDVSGNGLNLTGGTNSPADTPMPGVTIYLDLDNDGVLDSGEPSKVTDSSGSYSFTNLSPGTYYVREVVPAGFLRTGPALTDKYTVAVGNGTNSTGNDFANAEMCDTDTVYNISFKLVHADGTSEVVSDLRGQTMEGDVVTATFYVNADEGSHRVSLVSYTAPDNYFDANDASQQQISDLATGVFNNGGPYTLTVSIPNSYYQIDLVCGYAIDQLGPAGSNIFYTPQNRLESADNGGTHAPVANAGSISGLKFNDANGNGAKDAGESGLKNWVIYIDANNSGTFDAGERASVTRPDGTYTISNLPAGTFKVREVQQLGWTATRTPGPVTLTAGQDATGADFGNKTTATATVSGYKFNDRNADGEWDKNGLDNAWNTADDEVGMAGWTMFVDYNGDGIRQTSEPCGVTDANGYYSIGGVAAGTFQVCEVMQSGWIRTSDDEVVTLAQGGSAAGVNFGNFHGDLVMDGDTATISFWKGANGQALLKKLNGGGTYGTATALGNWLATNFPRMYGSGCGTANLAGKTNAQISAYFNSLANAPTSDPAYTAKQLAAQVLGTVFAVYVTDSDWAGGTYAAYYNFNVDTVGVKDNYYNIGNNGAAFGVVDDSALTVWDIVQRSNARAVNGTLWSGYDTATKTMAKNVYVGINQSGGITG